MEQQVNKQQIFYPAISSSDQLWGLNVTTVGYQSVAPFSVYPTSDHPQSYSFKQATGRTLNEYQLVYISRGSGHFQSHSVAECKVSEGMMFMLFPDEWHTYHPELSEGWDTYWIGFCGQQVDQLITNSFLSPKAPFFHLGMNEQIVSLLLGAIDQAKNEKPGFQQFLAGTVSMLLGIIYQQKRNDDFLNDTDHWRMNKAKVLMKERSEQNIRPENIASELSMSYSWFRRMFREYTGISPAQYLCHLRVQKARELLEQTQMTVKEIATKMNFESTGYFSVYFKRNTGTSPEEFRRKRKLS